MSDPLIKGFVPVNEKARSSNSRHLGCNECRHRLFEYPVDPNVRRSRYGTSCEKGSAQQSHAENPRRRVRCIENPLAGHVLSDVPGRPASLSISRFSAGRAFPRRSPPRSWKGLIPLIPAEGSCRGRRIEIGGTDGH